MLNCTRPLSATLASIVITMIFGGSTAFAQMISPAAPPGPGTPSPSVSSPSLPSDCPPQPDGRPADCTNSAGPARVPAPPAADYVSGGSGPPGAAAELKALSYFQRGSMQLDTTKAFGFVLLPKSAITDREQRTQKQFCDIMLASLDYVSPETASSQKVLATYWPIVADVAADDIAAAFESRNCNALIAWYDYSLGRAIASKAGVLGMSGPLLITWPSQSALIRNPRDPLIVDFANADYENANRALAHWFRQVSRNPDAWTNYIREGTIRAELADAINETAGVMLAVLAGKWDSVTVVNGTP
jgi:hypothetical protein